MRPFVVLLGKGPSIWDQFTHDNPNLIADHSNADIGPNSYHLFEEDIKAMKDIGVNNIRFESQMGQFFLTLNLYSSDEIVSLFDWLVARPARRRRLKHQRSRHELLREIDHQIIGE